MKKYWIAVLSCLMCSLVGLSQPSTDAGDPVYDIVEEMPRFPSDECELETLTASEKKKCAETQMLSHVYSTLTYPEEARENGVEGITVVSFIIEKDGTVKDPKIVRSLGNGCDEIVIDLINNMPKWIPGKKDGAAARVRFNLPIRFKLQSIEDELAKLNEVIEYEGITALMCAPFVGDFIEEKTIHEAATSTFDSLDLCGYKSSVVYLSIGRSRNDERIDYNSTGELTTDMIDLLATAQKDDALFMEFDIDRSGLKGKIIKVIIVE